jgi:hypothetical protein
MGRVKAHRQQPNPVIEPAHLNLLLQLLEDRAERGANRLATRVNKVHNPDFVTVSKHLSQSVLIALGIVD